MKGGIGNLVGPPKMEIVERSEGGKEKEDHKK